MITRTRRWGLWAMAAAACFAGPGRALPEEASAGTGAACHPPSPAFPYFHADLPLPAGAWEGVTVESVAAGGRDIRDFSVWNGDAEAYDKIAKGTGSRVVAAYDWSNGERVEFTIAGKGKDGAPTRLALAAQAPASGGWWDRAWKRSVSVVVTERHGVRRARQPVHVTLGLFADQVTDPAREIRVVTAGADGAPVEAPSQAYNVTTWDRREIIDHPEKDAKTGAPLIRCHATTMAEVVFLADLEPRASRVYLVYYGNPSAPAPAYATDLQVTGTAPGRTVENAHYRIVLHDKSGQITEVASKRAPDRVLEHKLETNGALHWNPDLYAPPHAWVHVSDWEKPSMTEVAGPVFFMTRRSAPLPRQPKTHAAVTYRFYAGSPWIEAETLLEVQEDFDLQSLRNGEIVLNRKVADEFAWRDRDGALRTIDLGTARPHPGHAVEIPPDVEWLAFLSRGKGVGLAGIPLFYDAFNREGGAGRTVQPYFYVACGLWFYWSRALVYSFGSNNPTRMLHVPAGSVYRERTAYLPFATARDDAACFADVDAAQRVLASPLAVRTWQATDARTPWPWVAPILTEPFEEGVKGAVGGQTGEEKK